LRDYFFLLLLACDNTDPAKLLDVAEECEFLKTEEALVASLEDDCFLFMIYLCSLFYTTLKYTQNKRGFH